jgi:hypothetical protein
MVALAVTLMIAFSPVHARGVTVDVPVGWHTAHGRGDCDPEQLLVVSSEPIRRTQTGRFARPSPGHVLVFVLEDHAVKPVGDLRRPHHFKIAWHTTRGLEPCCGEPDGPASMHWFRQHGRYLGFVVFMRGDVPAARRATTEHVLDSLRL